MIGKSTLIWIGLAGVASVILYQTSYRVQEKSDQLAKLNRQIVAEQEAIQVLRAEWAFLNDPARLEQLVARHTGLVPATVAQIATLEEIPHKPVPEVAPTPETPAGEEAPALLLSAAPKQVAPQPAAPKPATSKPARPTAPVQLADYGAESARGAQ